MKTNVFNEMNRLLFIRFGMVFEFSDKLPVRLQGNLILFFFQEFYLFLVFIFFTYISEKIVLLG